MKSSPSKSGKYVIDFSDNNFIIRSISKRKKLYILQMWQDIRLTNSVGNNQFLGDMFEGFLDQGVKQSEGQYFTPMPICRFIFMSLPLQSMVTGSATPTKAIDYACGAGHFLNELASQIKPLITQLWQGELVDLTDHLKAQHRTIYGIEKEYRLSKVAKVSAFMYGQQDINICYGDGLVQQHSAFPGIQNDSFDLLVANPPYSVRGFLETLPEEERDNYALSDTVDKLDSFNSIEAFFIERAKQLLKAGGVAAIILPSSILSNGSGTYIKTREILLQYFDIVAIAELGSGTFGKTGTNTVTLFLRRKKTTPDTAEHYRERVAQWFNTDDGQTEYQDAHLIEHYATHIGVPLADYNTLRAGVTAGPWTQSAHFDVYTKAFNDSTEVKNLYKQKAFKLLGETLQTEQLEKRYLRYVTELERDKLYYFVLACDQAHPVLIVKSPSDNKAQKAFLGYDWSTSKGDEGIKLVKNAQGHHQTHLYDETDRNNASKLNRLIADNFDGKLGAIPAALSEFSSTARLVDMLDFSRAGFEKPISLSEKLKASISTQWELKKLSEVSLINPSKVELKNIDPNTIVSFIEMSSVNEGGFISQMEDRKLSDLKKGSYTYFAENDIILAKITPCMENGKCALAKNLSNGIGMGSSEFHVFRMNKHVITPEFAFAFLNRAELRVIAENNMTGSSGHRRVPESFYADIQIPIPPLDIQILIVAEFNSIDSEVVRAKKSIATAQAAINAQVKQCFSRHPLKQLNQIADLSRGASPRPIDDFWTEAADGVPWIKIGDVAPGAKYIEGTAQKITPAGAEKSKRVHPGDFIISNSMSVGRPYILAIEGCVHDGWLVLANIIDAVDKDYLYYALSSDSAQSQFQAQALGGVVKNLNIERAKGVTIAVPPLDEQQKLVAAVQVIEQTIAQAQAILTAAPAKKQAVMQRYL